MQKRKENEKTKKKRSIKKYQIKIENSYKIVRNSLAQNMKQSCKQGSIVLENVVPTEYQILISNIENVRKQAYFCFQ